MPERRWPAQRPGQRPAVVLEASSASDARQRQGSGYKGRYRRSRRGLTRRRYDALRADALPRLRESLLCYGSSRSRWSVRFLWMAGDMSRRVACGNRCCLGPLGGAAKLNAGRRGGFLAPSTSPALSLHIARAPNPWLRTLTALNGHRQTTRVVSRAHLGGSQCNVSGFFTAQSPGGARRSSDGAIVF